MNASDSAHQPRKYRKIRRDGWTPERQLRFLAALSETGKASAAAAAAGMSRESAYRFRARAGNALFAAAWDKALRPQPKSHEVGVGSRLSRGSRIARFRANPPKVTKLAKFVSPRFDPLSLNAS